jgi:hypothetical protein
MPNTTIRISPISHKRLKKIALENRQTMNAVLDDAVKEYYIRLFWRKVAADFDALSADKKAWEEEKREMELWDATLQDGADEW